MADNLHLVRDLLDAKVVDRNGREMGRVDGIVVEVTADAPPRVTAIEIGPSVLAERVGPLFGRIAAAIERVLDIDEGRPIRIPFAAILDTADHVRVDVAVGETAAATLERRLRGVFGSIPGGSS